MNHAPIQHLNANRVTIIGAGLIGLATAWELLRRGWGVSVREEHEPGAGASGAAAGMLGAVAEAVEEGRLDTPTAALCRQSAALWPEWAAQLERETGVELGFGGAGTVLVALDDASAQKLEVAAERFAAQGVEIAVMKGETLRAHEPGLAHHIQTGLFAPGDLRADARAVVSALRRAVEAHPNGTLATGDAVLTGPADRKMRFLTRSGVGDAGGSSHSNAVVVAGGWRSGKMLPVWLKDAVVPVKGQMLALEAGAAAPRHVVRGPGVYLVPRAGGRVLVGASVRPGEADTVVDPATTADLLQAATRLIPAMAGLAPVETWAGVRPASRDGAPLIGAIGEGVYVAAGHHRNGVLLAPITARIIADAIADGVNAPSAFSPSRFTSD